MNVDNVSGRPETPRNDETISTPSNQRRLINLGEAVPIDEDMEPLVRDLWVLMFYILLFCMITLFGANTV